MLLSIRVNTIDGLMKRRVGIEEVRGGHDDGHPVRALQVQQTVDTSLELERLVLAVGDVPGVLLILIHFGALFHLGEILGFQPYKYETQTFGQ